MIGSTATQSLPLHPTQLYSSLDSLVILVLLSAFYPLRRRDGEVMGLLMVAYPITRFLIEYLRNDEGVFFAGLTISQNISLLLLLGDRPTGSGSRGYRKVATPTTMPSGNRQPQCSIRPPREYRSSGLLPGAAYCGTVSPRTR